ncbi:MAG: 2-oxoacid:acceptor oxidoreductase subunit alpha [Phycisphaeraceae bacterium]|nr:2-oxoacid:acceptor oxidoreductase subunit alpha [Phycisphaerales bacterium]MCB9861614.1 2-oxoacid:acceptor oxidoreductase subunit alpha [Phycisphaeraceae bacterium]
MSDTHAEPTRLAEAVVRFCGDSGDGMQLAGGQFADTSAIYGNDFATFPDFPAEIRAPRGTTFGVSGFQIHFSDHDIFTPGDAVQTLVAMNPAGFKTNIDDVESGGTVIVDEDEFTSTGLTKCGYPKDYNPLDDDAVIQKYRIIKVPISRLTRESLATSDLGAKAIDRCRNMYALGIVYWLYDRPLEPTIRFLERTFSERKKQPEIADLNIRALKAGYYFGETAELWQQRHRVVAAPQQAGTYRRISGNEAVVLGFVTAAHKAGKSLTYASYPITPASDIIHGLSRLKQFGVRTFQAEDEIAAVCAAIGASFAGDIGVTGTSGPGLALKGEALGLAVMMELPLVVVDVQRAGPSTGMPTKTEQADLFQAMYGRSGESPCIVLAPCTPSDCFTMAIEAVRLATAHMCPVILLSDAYIANGAEPWRVPDLGDIPSIDVQHPAADENANEFHPYDRINENLARPWAIPGTPGLEHRLGGLEKQAVTGSVSYDPDNHDAMLKLRADKVQRAAKSIPPVEVYGDQSGEMLVLGWGGTYGSLRTAVDQLRACGASVSLAHLRYLHPFPSNLGDVLKRFERVVVPEINLGQLSRVIRAEFLFDAVPINSARGRPLGVEMLVEEIAAIMNSGEVLA